MNCKILYVGVVGLLVFSVACTHPRQQGNGHENDDEQVTGFFDSNLSKEERKTAETDRVPSSSNVTMMELPAPLKDRSEQILKRTGFTISYNKARRVPNWVAWHLTKSHTYGSAKRNEEMFLPDDAVPSPRATDNDYYNSRYDRGHMCPAGDNKWNKEAMRESFLFTNTCPQNHGLNKNAWNDLEIQCRQWAREYGSIDIACGPIFYGRGEQKTIGSNKVWVPDAFFKVVLCRKGTPKALGFIYHNRGGSQTMSDCVCTVDEVEELTGIDFFPSLADHIEDKVEAKARLADW